MSEMDLRGELGLGRRIRSLELRFVLALLVIVGSLWAFAAIADEVSEGETRPFDAWVLEWLRAGDAMDAVVGPVWLETALIDLTALGGVTSLGLLTSILLGFWALKRAWIKLLIVALAFGGGVMLTQLLKWLFARERPDVVPHLVDVYTYSFPSGHATMSAAVYITLGAFLAKWSESRALSIYIICVAIGLTVLVGLSRVALGVHFPTDVIAGWTVGTAWALICWMIVTWVERQRSEALESPRERDFDASEGDGA